MKLTENRLYRILPFVTAFIAVIFFGISAIEERTEGKTERVASRAGRRVEKRMDILEDFLDRTSDDGISCLEEVPEDMVIYKYVNDSLVFWSNQFSVLNDDISNRLVFQRLTNLKSRIVSPLINIPDSYSYISLGPKWYLVKSTETDAGERIIAGIEIKNTLTEDRRRYENGINPMLDVPAHFTIQPLNYSGGTTVQVHGVPMFKIHSDNVSGSASSGSSIFKLLAMLFVSLSVIIRLATHRTMRTFAFALFMLTAVAVSAYIWGLNLSGNTELFSPNTYADGPMLFSLGALLLINTFLTMTCLCIYMMRHTFLTMIQRNKATRKKNLIVYCLALSAVVAGTIAYTHMTLNSLLQNSSISLEFYRTSTQAFTSVIVYLSYIGLTFCTLFYLRMLSPAVRELTGRSFSLTSKKSLACFAFCVAAYFSITIAVNGIQRESERVAVWANRLAVERDLGLEIRLKAIEDDIASDKIIASLAGLDNANEIILNRISENFLSRIRQNYSISLMLLSDTNKWSVHHYNSLIASGTPLYDGSRFFFVSDAIGHSRYIGRFAYYLQDRGPVRMFLEIEPNSSLEERGYNSILKQFSAPEGINIPNTYSYAKYSEGKLTSYKGNFPYPTVSDNLHESRPGGETRTARIDDYTHFIHHISDAETIIISRPKTGGIVFFISFSYLFLIIMGLLVLLNHRRHAGNRNKYFRNRINSIMFITSTMILTSMTVVSIFFVYKRNRENTYNIMSSRITTVQALVNRQAKNAETYAELTSPGARTILEDISKTTKSDISLYTPDGRIFYSSTPDVFEKMILGNRINREAFHNIRHLHQRFHINRENIAGYGYWAIYAPIINANGEIVAIAGVPYTHGDHGFRREVFRHAATLINIFLLLLIMSLLFSTREVNEMFTPLTELGRKMNVTDIYDLKPISYKREDEISSLVDAYNRMVKELADSTVRLAQAERDKAWSQMARQVAHEIKNPLTPIKLEIQRLIRLKENSNPKWEEKFDKVATVVLEHIDILTETANEFSTFAKLYSEEPVLMDLDKTLRDQILIFDNKENIRIDYVGMEGAAVMAPRPQLIRVFVNLITNAIQAVEIRQREMSEKGEGLFEGKVFITLRNGTRDGYYDILVDDNGYGVKDENLGRLFTPNFTTKSGGTGLGLAICRNIIEKCEGTITYSKSFMLGGASFTVSIPKHLG